MSKPAARVTLFVLISLVLIAATSVSVRGLWGGAREASGVQAHVVGNFNQDRSTISELESQQLQGAGPSMDRPGKGGHDCESEAQVNPNDY
jgi:hypothetical protein